MSNFQPDIRGKDLFDFPSIEGWSIKATSAQDETRPHPYYQQGLTGSPAFIPTGPYIIWWRQDIRSNPVYTDYAERGYPRSEPRPQEYMPQQHMIVRYEEPEDWQGTILWQSEPEDTSAKYVARSTWDMLVKEQYPYYRSTK